MALTLLWSSATLTACDKAEEIAGKVAGKEDDKPEDKPADGKDSPADGDDGKAGEDAEAKPEAKPEPIPVEPLHTGLDLMLSFVPDTSSEFMIIRDASVIEEYYEEAVRFLDTPIEKLGAADSLPREMKEASTGFELGRLKGKEIVAALGASGLRLKDGGALIKTSKGKDLLVFASDDPGAIGKLATALGESKMDEDHCGPLPGVEGWSVCSDDKASLESFKPTEDPSEVRAKLQEKLPGVDLDEANVLADIDIDQGRSTFAITTLPGLVHIAGVFPLDNDGKEMFEALDAGDAKTLANVQAGAGFVWARTKSEVLSKAMASEMRGSPPEAKAVFESFNGEWVLAGSVDPGGLVFQAGIDDAGAFTALWDQALVAAKAAPTEIPELPGSKLTIEKTPIKHGTTVADAMHVAVTGVEEADIVKAFAGIHFDGWAFAANDALTVTLGPDAEHVGKLLDTSGGGPTPDMLSSLPPPLAAGFKRKEVSMAIHMPADFLQGKHLHAIVNAALKNVPEAKPEVLLAAASMLAPISSGSIWFEQPEGAEQPVIHMALQGIGNRATDEGKAALDAAHKVTEGTDPETAFKPLAEKYDSSAMAFAYHTRAGTEGPGSLVGSGIGAVAVAGAVSYATLVGAANESLADDLGVKPDDPEPEIALEHKPVAPIMEPKKEDPKEDPKKGEPKKNDPKKGEPKKNDPKKDPPKTDPKKGEPKKDDPIVEPGKPPVPVPKPTTDDPEKKKKKGKKKKGKKKKGKKKKKG